MKKVNAEEEMIEEHLDEEYQNSDMEEEFAELEKQIVKLKNKQLAIKHDPELVDKLEKAITLLRLHVQNYQRIIIFNRRRARQRLKRRQCTIRNFFLQSLMEMQIRFVETLPLAIEPSVFLEYKPNAYESVGNSSPLSNISCESDMEECATLRFYEDVVTNFNDDQWLDTFHMSKNIFNIICSKLKASVDNVGMHYNSWIAMCIYTIATGSKFSSVALLFNVKKNFVRKSLYRFLQCIINEFMENQLFMPKTKDEFERISHGFQKASNMTPCVVGVLSVFELQNYCRCERRKSCVSDRVIVQINIDDRLIFRKVEVSNQKPSMFLRSPNEISTIWKKFSDSCVVPYFVVAPPLYPLRTWLMQRYENPREIWEHNFNKSFDNLNIFREVSLQRLFGRWQILLRSGCMQSESKCLIVKACCVLHNLLEKSGELFSDEWSKNINLSKYEHKLNPTVTMCFNDSGSAIEKRDTIARLIQS